MRDLTPHEKKSIAALKRLAAQWPKTLRIIHSGSSGTTLSVQFNDDSDPGQGETVASIQGFNADSCA